MMFFRFVLIHYFYYSSNSSEPHVRYQTVIFFLISPDQIVFIEEMTTNCSYCPVTCRDERGRMKGYPRRHLFVPRHFVPLHGVEKC